MRTTHILYNYYAFDALTAGAHLPPMRLYFSPLACSLASRIALYETEAAAEFIEVDSKTKRTSEDRDFFEVYPLGLVPVLELDDGELLTENSAILQYLADAFPQAALAPPDTLGRARLRQWLSFIATELHKALFVPLLDKTASDEARAFALSKRDTRMAFLERHLERREYLLPPFSGTTDPFTVADAYLYTILNWTMVTPVDLDRWPAVKAYHARVGMRPSVKRAFSDERMLYGKELLRHAAIDVKDAIVSALHL
jgi:glutathione S-transferase